EIFAVAKEILKLIEDHGMEPTDIGVVARVLDPVLTVVRKVFDENRIAFSCPLGEPLIHHPLVKTIVQFMGLRSAMFPRAGVLDVLTSPFCRVHTGSERSAPRVDQWDRITRRLNITKGTAEGDGLGDWVRLQRATDDALMVPSMQDSASRHVPQAETLLLWQMVRQLLEDLSALPTRAGWKEYTTIFMNLLPRWFELSAWTEDIGTTLIEQVHLAVRAGMRSVETLDLLE